MNENHEVHKLVIRNMAVLEQAPPIVNEAEKRIFGAIDKKIEAWARAQEGWAGVFNFLEDETSFKPEVWPVDANGDRRYFFGIGLVTAEGLQHSLSALVGAVDVQFGIHFIVDAPWVTGLENQKRAQPGKKWNSYLKSHLDEFPKLSANGFRQEGESLFCPVQIDAAALAEAFPDTLDDALEPIDEALAHVVAALSDFDRLIDAARAHFARCGEEVA